MMVLFEGIILFSYYLLFSQIYAVFNRIQSETHLRNTERYVLPQKKYYEEIDKGTSKQRELLLDKTGRQYARRFINIKSRVDKGRLIIRIENTFDDMLRMDLGNLYRARDRSAASGWKASRT